MLRTGVLLKNRKIDLSLMERHSRGIVVLHETKSGQRTASSETVVIFDAYLVRMLAIVCRDLAPADFLVGCSPAVFRAKFARLVQEAGLPRCNWKPYSLRRGGAIFFTTVNWIAPWSADDGPLPRQHGSTLTMLSQCKHNLLSLVSKIAP